MPVREMDVQHVVEAGVADFHSVRDSADLIFALDSIDHWQDKAAGLREIRRVLPTRRTPP
jgi:hypothetical protein